MRKLSLVGCHNANAAAALHLPSTLILMIGNVAETNSSCKKLHIET